MTDFHDKKVWQPWTSKTRFYYKHKAKTLPTYDKCCTAL